MCGGVLPRPLDLVGNNDSTFYRLPTSFEVYLGDPNSAVSISILRFSESRLIGNGEFRGRLCSPLRVCLTYSDTGSQEPAISLKYSDFIPSVST